jgi:ATP-dependent 26S proteasome regulatory subunit
MIQRKCKLSQINSFFLFGPRGVGKTTLLEDIFSEIDSLFIDLLDPEIFAELVLDSSRFTAMIDSPENRGKRVIIEGVQKNTFVTRYCSFSDSTAETSVCADGFKQSEAKTKKN